MIIKVDKNNITELNKITKKKIEITILKHFTIGNVSQCM